MEDLRNLLHVPLLDRGNRIVEILLPATFVVRVLRNRRCAALSKNLSAFAALSMPAVAAAPRAPFSPACASASRAASFLSMAAISALRRFARAEREPEIAASCIFGVAGFA